MFDVWCLYALRPCFRHETPDNLSYLSKSFQQFRKHKHINTALTDSFVLAVISPFPYELMKVPEI